VSGLQPQMNVNVTVLQQANVICLNMQLTLQCLTSGILSHSLMFRTPNIRLRCGHLMAFLM